MKLLAILFVFYASSVSAVLVQKNRCGYIANTSSQNVVLKDVAGTWTITSANHVAKGKELAPPSSNQDVAFEGGFGYYCGCVNGVYSLEDKTVISIISSEAKKLSHCLKIRGLDSSHAPRRMIQGQTGMSACRAGEQSVFYRSNQVCVNQSGDYWIQTNLVVQARL